MTQSDFGRIVGVNKQTVSKWENGTLAPSMEKTIEIAEAMNVDLKELREETDMPIFQKRTKYNIGLNVLYQEIKNFQLFYWFVDACWAVKKFFGKYLYTLIFIKKTLNDSDEEEFVGLVIATESNLIIFPLSFELITKYDKIFSPYIEEKHIVIPKEDIKRIESVGNVNNFLYVFDIYFEQKMNDCDDELYFQIFFEIE